MIDKKIFSLRFGILRNDQNITMVDVAKALGINKSSVHRWATEETVPTADALVALADYLNVSIDYLVGRSDNPERK